MKHLYLFFAFIFFSSLAQAQNFSRRNTNKTVPYRGNYQRITAGSRSFSSFEIRNGTLWAWGYNQNGQLGDGTGTNQSNAVQIGNANNWVAISSGDEHAIGLKSDGTLWAWGLNMFGQLGDGTNISKDTPLQIGNDSNWISISVGASYSLAIKADGTLWAWGYNAYGQLGDGTTTNRNSPIKIGTANNWVSISAGANHSMALKSDGSLWAWGANDVGQLGDGTTTSRTSPVQVGTANNWTSISVGYDHSLAIKSDGTLWACGYNRDGQLGDGTTTYRNTPVQVGTANNWVSASTGEFYSIALKSDGTLWAWGYNGYQLFGDGTTNNRNTPTQIGISNNWVSVSAGAVYALALKADGSIWAWGSNYYGQLGDGTTVSKTVPTQIGVSRNEWLRVEGGYSHTVGLKSDGTLWAWGTNYYGQLGDGTYIDKSNPVQFGTDNNWIGFSAGYEYTIGLKVDGTLWACGYNMNIFQQIGNSNNWVSISSSNASYNHLALKSDGTLWAWGYNNSGQLGNGTANSSLVNVPIQVGTSNDWISASIGNYHALAIKSDGTLWSWGYNVYGQLGDGTGTDRYSPIQIGTANNWQSTLAGGLYSLAIKSDGTLWSWGDNREGQLGDGTTTIRSSSVQIGTANNWVNISAGGAHSLAIKSNGSLWAWGYNFNGQLGDGTTINKNIPTQISSLKSWVSISSGYYHSLALKSDRLQYCATGLNVGNLGDGTTTSKSTFVCNTNSTLLPPALAGFLPASGGIGTLLNISGTSLSGASAVGVGGLNAIIVSNTGSNLVAMLMPGSVSGLVWVKVGNDTLKSISNFIVTPTPFPFLQQGNKLIGTGNAGAAMQGYAVSISADGNTALIGASNDNGGIGAAWVYTRSNGVWTQQGNKIVASGNIGAGQFGTSVAISADGNTALIGAFNDSVGRGAAYVFTRSGTNWAQQGTKLIGTGNAGSASFMGYSVALSADGNTALVGGYKDNNFVGSTWVFSRNNGMWTQQGNKLIGNGANGNAFQGYSVALSADGNTALLGGISDSSGIGATWVFVRNAGAWTQQGTKLVGSGVIGTGGGQGSSVSLSADGNIAAIGAYEENSYMGATWVFSRTGTTWSQMGTKLVGTGSIGAAHQGSSVSLSADGKTLLVGGYSDQSNKGAAWVFTRNANTWQQQGTKINLKGTSGTISQIGNGLSLSADAKTALIGGYADSSMLGATWVIVSPDPPISNNAISGTQNICSGSSPNAFIGSIPIGGNGQYTYSWIKSTTNDSVGYTSISSSNNKDFASSGLTQKTWFKRCVVSGTARDTSAAIVISIDTNIVNNIIVGGNQTICNGSLASQIMASNPAGGNRNNYQYMWLISTSNADSGFTAIDSSNLKNYTPKLLSQNTWFKRRVVSGACKADTSAAIKISISVPVSNNMITSAPQNILEGSIPNTLNGSVPAGGDGASYTYTWLSSTINSNAGFKSIDSSNVKNYIPGKLFQNTWFRRIVKSGACNADTSVAVLISISYIPPVINSFAPISAKPGDIVSIQGLNFNPTPSNNIVYFGASKAMVMSASANTLLVKVPNEATHQMITVTHAISNFTAYSPKAFIPAFSCDGNLDTNSYFQSGSLNVGTTPFSIAVGDMDGDGNVDVVSSNLHSSTVSVLRNIDSAGIKTFDNKVDFATNGMSIAVALGDLNGDGKLDIAVLNENTSLLAVFKNTSTKGNISFAARQDYNTGLTPIGIAIIDMNLDGKPDIIVANNAENSVSVFKNNSTFSSIDFSTKVDFIVGNGPRSVAIGDIDTDGKPDIAVANGFSNSISILRNISAAGNIGFASKVDITTGDYPYCVSIGDLNLDGKPELLSANYNASSISVFTNNSTSGSLNISSKTDYSVGVNPQTIAMADVSGDGKLDVAVSNVNSNYLSIFNNASNLSTISLSNKTDFANNTGGVTINAADLDKDGRPELLIGTWGSEYISVFKNMVFGIRPSAFVATNNKIQCFKGNNFEFRDSSSITSGTYQTLWRFGPLSGDTSTAKNISVSFDKTGEYQVTLIATSNKGCMDSNMVDVNVRNPGTWFGEINNSWENPLNWSCPILPDSSMDVYITSGVPNNPIVSNTQSVMSLNILPNANLKLNVSSSQLNIYGDVSNAGVFDNTNGKVVFRGNQVQNVANASFNKLEINKESFVSLKGAVIIKDSILLTKGNIKLENNTLTINQPKKILSSENSYLITNGNGSILANNIDSFLYTIPIGGSSYSPIRIANYGTTDNFSFRLIDSVNTKYINDNPSGIRVSSGIVNKTWIIREAIPRASNAKIIFQWNGSDEQNSFDKNNAYVAKYDESSGSWMKDNITAVNGSNPYQISQSGINTFGPFALSSLNVLSAPENLTNENINIYPNPANEEVFIISSKALMLNSITVTDVSGRLVKSINTNNNNITINTTELKSGMYFINISGNEYSISRKIIIQH